MNSLTFGLESKTSMCLQKVRYFPPAHYEITTVQSMPSCNKYWCLFIPEMPLKLFTITPNTILLHVSRLTCFPCTYLVKSKLAHCWLFPFSLFLSETAYPTTQKCWKKLCESHRTQVVLHIYLLLKVLLLITQLRNCQRKLHIIYECLARINVLQSPLLDKNCCFFGHL